MGFSNSPDVTPVISVVLPTFNRRDHLPRAIESVLAQTFTDFELIVVDDGSTDGSQEYIGGLTDLRMRYLRQAGNRGQSSARNAGIRAARAELIAFQDSDDVWAPEKLALQYDELCRHPDVAMVYADMLRVPSAGGPYLLAAPELRKGQLFDQRRSVYATFAVGIQSCLIRRDVLRKLSAFDEALRQYEDLDLFLRIVRKHRVLRIAQPLVTYYETADSVSSQDQHNAGARWGLMRRHGLRMLLARPKAFRKELLSLVLGRREKGLL